MSSDSSLNDRLRRFRGYLTSAQSTTPPPSVADILEVFRTHVPELKEEPEQIASDPSPSPYWVLATLNDTPCYVCRSSGTGYTIETKSREDGTLYISKFAMSNPNGKHSTDFSEQGKPRLNHDGVSHGILNGVHPFYHSVVNGLKSFAIQSELDDSLDTSLGESAATLAGTLVYEVSSMPKR